MIKNASYEGICAEIKSNTFVFLLSNCLQELNIFYD